MRVFRSTLVQLETRMVNKGIHVLTTRAIPSAVQISFRKGGKFIIDPRSGTHHDIRQSLEQLERSLNLKAFFQQRPTTEGSAIHTKCKLKSSWNPRQHPDVSKFIKAAAQDLHLLQRGHKRHNIGYLDRRAIRWIRDNRHICIVDCDKNVGDAIADRNFVEQECRRLLHEGFEQVPATCNLLHQVRH